MFDTLLFDFYGVLHPDPLQSWLDKYGYQKDDWASELAAQLDLAQINFRQFIGSLASRYGHPEAGIHQEMVAVRDINHGLVEMIRDHRLAYKIGLLSNSHTEEIRPVLQAHQLYPLFDHITISSEVKVIKPDPAIFGHALDGLESVAEQTIFVDDTFQNVNAARQLGLTAIHFQNNSQLLTDLGQLMDRL